MADSRYGMARTPTPKASVAKVSMMNVEPKQLYHESTEVASRENIAETVARTMRLLDTRTGGLGNLKQT
jgi:hypothetical protein